MTNANNDVRELEELLTELEGQGALPVGPYSDEDDAVTQLMDAPLGEQEWMVQITPVDRRMMSTDQLLAELGTGSLVQRNMLVWRAGMNDWAPISRIDELQSASSALGSPSALQGERRPLPPAPLPPPTPIPPPRLGSSAMAAPVPPAPRVPPPAAIASTPFGAPRPPTPVPPASSFERADAPSPPSALPLLNSAFGSPGAPPVPPVATTFNVPPPAAAAPLPPTLRVSTQRPVAVDFSEMDPVRTAPTRVLVGSGLAALAMIVGTVYALSAGGVFESAAEVAPEPVAASRAPAAASPAPAAAARAEAKPAEPKPAPAPEAKPAAAAADEPLTQPASAKEELAVPAPEAEETAPKASRAEAKAKASEPEPSEKSEKKAEAEASKSESEEEESEPTSSRAERRLAARRNKRASEDAPAPRRNKPRAAAAAPAPAAADADESAKVSEPPGSTFNRQAAKTALDDAAAQARNCRPQGGQSGSGRVQVRYEPSGKVGAVSILTPTFDNTTTGDCVVMVFRRANIPAFTGSPAVVMNKNFEIP